LATIAELFRLRFKVLAVAGSTAEVALSDAPTPVEVTVDFEAVAADRVAGRVTVPGGIILTPESLVMKVVGPAVDGRLELEIRAPKGVTVWLEGSDLLRPWTSIRSVVGQGAGEPIRIVVTPDSGTGSGFWRLKAAIP
jgi:hypothetical protein